MSINTMIFLVGGKGTRLGQKTKNCPKPLLPFRGKPFLAWQCEFLAKMGITHFVFATGYLKDFFADFAEKWLPKGCSLEIIEESEPLGTGGSLFQAVKKMKKVPSTFLAGNGDSFWNLSLLEELIKTHQKEKVQMTILCTLRNRPDQSGVVLKNKKIVEWDVPEVDFINAGLYVFQKNFFENPPLVKNFSLEKMILPQKIKTQKVAGIKDKKGIFLDFGTPQFYDATEDFLINHFINSNF